MVPASGVEIYVFAGPTSMDAVRRFNLFNGGGVLPPRWGLGFTQRVKSLYTSEEVEKEAAAFAKKVSRLIISGWNRGGKANLIPAVLNGIKNVIRNHSNL
jgi:hypothetical protein